MFPGRAEWSYSLGDAASYCSPSVKSYLRVTGCDIAINQYPIIQTLINLDQEYRDTEKEILDKQNAYIKICNDLFPQRAIDFAAQSDAGCFNRELRMAAKSSSQYELASSPVGKSKKSSLISILSALIHPVVPVVVQLAPAVTYVASTFQNPAQNNALNPCLNVKSSLAEVANPVKENHSSFYDNLVGNICPLVDSIKCNIIRKVYDDCTGVYDCVKFSNVDLQCYFNWSARAKKCLLSTGYDVAISTGGVCTQIDLNCRPSSSL